MIDEGKQCIDKAEENWLNNMIQSQWMCDNQNIQEHDGRIRNVRQNVHSIQLFVIFRVSNGR